jgi:hypothetical protein
MAQPVNNTPLLPRASGSSQAANLARFDADLSRALFQELTSHAFRLNGAIMKDGSEPMTGPLVLSDGTVLPDDLPPDPSTILPLDATDPAEITGLGTAAFATLPLDATDPAEITGLAPVATSGNASDVSGLAAVATSGAASDISGLATVATSGSAADLATGTLPDARISETLAPAQAFRRGNILGTVTQSGGVPTGALIERGSNSNGEYVSFAGTSLRTFRLPQPRVTFSQVAQQVLLHGLFQLRFLRF